MALTVTAHKKWLHAMHRGHKRHQQSRLQDALTAYSRAVKISPDRAESWCNLGGVLIETGDVETAITALKKALKLNPSLIQVHTNMGDAWRQLGHAKNAIASYTQALCIQRSPNSLNKLAGVLRQLKKNKEAENLYREAIRLQSDFTISRVNLATLHVDVKQYSQALDELKQLQHFRLPSEEQKEVQSVHQALTEFQRIEPVIQSLRQGEFSLIQKVLESTEREKLEKDDKLIRNLSRYADSGKNLIAEPLLTSPLSNRTDWPYIEAMYMIPLVDNIAAYQRELTAYSSAEKLSTIQRESFNMVMVIEAMRSAQMNLSDPVLAEIHLRHWHILAGDGFSNFLPGHFKITRNLTLNNPTTHRAAPHLVVGSFRSFIQHIYPQSQPGLHRALLCWMAVCDIHPFVDGNGRIGLSWMNRELEWAGLTPCLFTRELGIRGELGRVMKHVRATGNISLLVPVIKKAQQETSDFCAKLNLS